MIITIIKKIKMKKRNNNKPTMNPDATTQKIVFCCNFPSFSHPDYDSSNLHNNIHNNFPTVKSYSVFFFF